PAFLIFGRTAREPTPDLPMRYLLLAAVLLAAVLVAAPAARAQDLTFEEYEPRSTLVVPGHRPTRAKYPFVDVHSRPFGAATMGEAEVAALVAAMDSLNMAVMVNLSGG